MAVYAQGTATHGTGFDRGAIQGEFVNYGGKLHAKSSLTDSQLKAAVAANPAILTPGWTYSNGSIIRGTAPATAAPAATAPAAAPATVNPTPPPPPTLDQFGNYQDPTYWNDLGSLRGQLGLIQNPDGSLVDVADQQKLTGLNQMIDPTTFKPVAPGGVGGKTMYDILYGQQQQRDLQNVTQSRSDAAKHGVLSSGYMDRQLADVAGQGAAAADNLVRNYGTDLTDSRSAAYQASQAQADAIRNYQAQQGTISNAATSRGYENALTGYHNTYGGY